jgi:hypothetical protein
MDVDDDISIESATLRGREAADAAAARDMAWNWFMLHAQQRLTVFRSYLLISGALFAGYGTILSTGAVKRAVFLLLVSIISLLITLVFSRLDKRNAELIKIGEGYLDAEQERLETALKFSGVAHDKLRLIRLVQRSNEEREFRGKRYSTIYSFSEVNLVVFIGFGMLSFVGAGYGVCLLLVG